MNPKEVALYTLLIVLLSITAVVLWNGNLKVESDLHSITQVGDQSNLQELSTASVPIGDAATPFEIADTEGNLVSFDPKDSKLAMLIFFNPTDCAWCLLESSLWKEMSESYDPKDLYVIGIITEDQISARDALVFKKGRRLDFPILVGKEGHEISHSYGVTRTPTRILVDQTGKIIDAGYSVHSPTEHELLKEKVAMLIDRNID